MLYLFHNLFQLSLITAYSMILVVDTRWSGRWTKGGLGDRQKEVWVIDKRWSGRWTIGGLGDRQKVVWVLDKRWSR